MMAQSGSQRSIGHGDSMSYDYKLYLIEADDDCNYHYAGEDVQEVMEIFTSNHPNLKIKTVYLNVWENDYDFFD